MNDVTVPKSGNADPVFWEKARPIWFATAASSHHLSRNALRAASCGMPPGGGYSTSAPVR